MAVDINCVCNVDESNVKVCYPPTSIGGGVQSVVAGTNIAVDDTDPANPIVSSTGGGITGVGTVDYVPRIATIDGGGNVVTIANSRFFDNSTTSGARRTTVNTGIQFDSINGNFYGVVRVLGLSTDNGQVDLGVTTGTVRTGISTRPNNAYFGMCNDDFSTFLSFIRADENEQLFLQSIQLPNGVATAIGIDSSGMLVPVSGGGTTTNPLTIGTGLSGTSFDGSAPVTIQIDSTVATLTGSQTLTNKTISGASNTISNIAASAITAGTFGTGAYVMDTSLRVPNVIGSASASGTLTINSTSSGTKGFVYLGSSTGFSYDETNRRVGLGVASPTDILDVAGTVAGNLGILFRNSSTTGYTRIRVTNSNVGDYLQLTAYGTGVAAYGMVAAGEMNIYSTKNLNILTDVASGVIKFATGTGATERWRMGGEGFTNTAGTPTAYVHLKAGTTSIAQIRLASSTAPSSPNDGDIWFDGTDLKMRVAGVTKIFTLV